jgi:hypothetical protein
MMGQIIVGIQRQTEEIIPIGTVRLTGLKCDCICYECKGTLEAVLNTTRRKHFRHSNRANCNPTPETELHLLAKKIILDHNQINIADKGMVTYADPVTEVWYKDVVPDATIIIDGIPFYIEIVVTNPINSEKYLKYKSDLSPVLVITLSEVDRDLDYEALTDLVLNDRTNRYMLSYADQLIKKVEDDKFSWLPWAVLAGLAIWLLNRNRPKNLRIRRRRGF